MYDCASFRSRPEPVWTEQETRSRPGLEYVTKLVEENHQVVSGLENTLQAILKVQQQSMKDELGGLMKQIVAPLIKDIGDLKGQLVHVPREMTGPQLESTQPPDSIAKTLNKFQEKNEQMTQELVSLRKTIVEEMQRDHLALMDQVTSKMDSAIQNGVSPGPPGCARMANPAGDYDLPVETTEGSPQAPQRNNESIEEVGVAEVAMVVENGGDNAEADEGKVIVNTEKDVDFEVVDGDDADEEEEKHHASISLNESSSLASVFAADTDLEAPPYHVEEFYWKTGINQKIARSDRFANFTVFVVILNAVYIGFDSDYNNEQNIYRAHLAFQLFSQFFCVYFTWELVVRFLAFEHKHHCLKDGWFKFDTFLVTTMILDTWVLMPTLFFMGGGVQIPTQPLRMLRLFKLTRMARLMKALPELVTQIKGLFRSMRAISSSMILVGIMVYVWAIMMHMLMKDETDYNEQLWRDSALSFSTMTTCIWSLLMAGTMMLDNSSPLMSSLLFSDKFNYVLAGVMFVLYALMSAMCILQMLIGVLCDVVSTVKAEEDSATAIGLLKQELVQHLTACDDGDGKISRKELTALMHAPKSKALFRKLNINHAFLVELQKGLFRKPDSSVPILEILELMVQCRGENVATVDTMSGALVRLIHNVDYVKVILERDIGNLEKRLAHDIGSMRDLEKGRAEAIDRLERRLHEDIDHLEVLEAHHQN